MKKFYFFLLLLFAALFSFAQEKFQPKELYGNEANAVWEGTEHIWLKQENTVPSFIQFRDGSEPDEATFFFVLKKRFHLPSYYDFKLIGNETDAIGWQHKRFQVTVNNVPVTNGIFLLHLKHGKVRKYNGYLFKNITTNTSTSPALSESSALVYALKEVNAQTYKWQLPEEESFLKQETQNANATYFPKGTLEILQQGKNESNIFKLVWKFDIYSHAPLNRQYIYIDAQSGEVIKRSSRIENANVNGTAVTAYRGNRAIVADSYTGQYRLRETTRGQGIHTYNMLTGTTYGNAVEFLDADNIWNNVNAAKDQYAGDAHWGAEMTYDFYSSMGRNSIDANGFALNLYVHYDAGYFNAFWDGQRMNFGDGSGGYNPLTSLDITGHEISHGLCQYTANLDYQDEPGALNESFSDIFGTAVEWYADSTLGNWLIGEDIGGALRSMSNPNAYGDPDTYLGTNWYTGTGDYGGVHTNSNVQNQWYYRLSQGGSGTNDIGNAFNVTAIGRHKATQIAWRNEVNYLTSTSDYADARFYAIQSANDLFGTCSQEVISTTKAWYAVGVGGDYVAGADAQFSALPLTGCTLPFTVTFTNVSTNASSYTWYFGDGTSSTTTNPSHTYTLAGIYTVKLVANGGGTCGSDSIIYTNLININTSNPCVVILPVSGTYQTQTSCTGTIYDNGGSAGNYTNNTSSTVTISPVGASQVKLHFTQFAMEANYDYVYVYDGPTTASPVIGSYTGTTIPADITSSGSSITVRQYTDPGVVDAGFTIQWTCINPNNPPVANFKADVTQSCSGVIKFTDLTTGGANSWLWNFGDATTSTLQHPTHVYQTNGTFNVSLIATNTFGNNTATKNNYITITKPAGPTVGNSSSCGPQSFTLNTGDANPAAWFDGSGNVVSNSNPFVTPLLNNTTTYYVQDTISQPIYHAGPFTNTAVGANGAYFNGTQNLGLRFRVYKNSTLVSVLVYAQTAGYRTVQYRDSLGGVITNKTVYVAAGTNRLTLNINLLAGGPYELGLRDTLYLYRNQGGAVYPYNDANGIVSIIGNNAATAPTNYYFFYDWEVKEQDCISQQTPVTLTIKPAVTATSTFSNVSCFGGSNGSVSVTPVGGTPNFTYHWSNNATGASIANLSTGFYLVTVTDAAGCSVLSGQLVSQPTALVPAAIASNISCNGGNSGTINLNIAGGTPGYSFNWGNGVTSQNRASLIAGTYTVTITDANSCTVTSSSTLTQPAAIIASTTATNVSCHGGNNGTISLTVNGGIPNYAFNWGGGVTLQNRTNLTASTYTVTITDANSCTFTSSSTITQPTAINVSVTSNNTTCNLSNGTISVNASGGTPGYSYNWNTGGTTSSLSNLSSGNYMVTITDNNICTSTASAIISSSSSLAVNNSFANVNCFGSSDGNVAVTVINGTQPITYLWSNGTTTSSLTNLTAGNYSVTVTDGTGCSGTSSQTITEPAVLNFSITPTNASCNQSNGTIVTSISGGTAAYSYLWNTGANTSFLFNLAAGNFSVTVTDSHNCSASTSAAISNSSSLVANTTATNISCFGIPNGSANVNITSGTQPFSYLWSNGANTFSISNLAAGIYFLTITDGSNCQHLDTAVVTQPNPISVSVNVSEPLCNGTNDGSATVNAIGGTPNYTFNWSDNTSGNSISNLIAGNYSVTVNDANSCSSVSNFTVSEPAVLAVNTSTIDVACFGDATGSATATTSGGTPSYSYQWCNGNTTSIVSNLAAGNCSITITDVNGCTLTTTVSIAEPSDIQFTTSMTPATAGVNNGSATVTATGGVAPYSIQWSDGGDGTNLAAGTYSFTITDAKGCNKTGSVVIDQVTGLESRSHDLLFTVYPNPASSEVFIVINKWKDNTTVTLKNVLGQTLLSKAISSSTTAIDLSVFSAGVYLIELRQDGMKSIKEIVISR